MKYDTLRKIKRNQILISYRKQHPSESLEEIGQVFGISRQRISIILNGLTCNNCFHQTPEKLCACREPSDMLLKQCPDWYAKEQS